MTNRVKTLTNAEVVAILSKMRPDVPCEFYDWKTEEVFSVGAVVQLSGFEPEEDAVITFMASDEPNVIQLHNIGKMKDGAEVPEKKDNKLGRERGGYRGTSFCR